MQEFYFLIVGTEIILERGCVDFTSLAGEMRSHSDMMRSPVLGSPILMRSPGCLMRSLLLRSPVLMRSFELRYPVLRYPGLLRSPVLVRSLVLR